MFRTERLRRKVSAWPLCFFAAAALWIVLPSSIARSQQAVAQEPIRSSSDLVVLDVSVLDRSGNFVDSLTQSDFVISDDGENKQPVFFDSVSAPARVAVLVETGPAVYLIHEQHLAALSSLLEGLAADDEAALFTYAQSPRQVVPFTSDKAALLAAVGEPQYTIGMDQLNFYDSLRTIVNTLPGNPGKKSIVVLSTGLDSSSEDHWAILEHRLRTANVMVFPVALGGSLRAPPAAKKSKKKKAQPAGAGTDAFARADQALLDLAKITGGRAYFPKSPDEFAAAYREIAAVLRHQYILGITPERDGAFHKLSVEIVARESKQPKRDAKNPIYRPFYREGYVAPSP